MAYVVSKETYYIAKRNLLSLERAFMAYVVSKETYYIAKRNLLSLERAFMAYVYSQSVRIHLRVDARYVCTYIMCARS